MSLLKRAKGYLQDYGWCVGLALAIHRLLTTFGPHCGLYWYRFYKQPLTGTPNLRSSGALTYRWLPQYEEGLAVLPRPEVNLRARFAQDVQCLTASKGDELRACAWFGFGRFEEDEVRCTFVLPEDAVWDFDIYVVPQYRIGRVFLRTWQEANRKLSEEGFAKSFSRISVYNRNSVSSHEKLGASKVGGAMFLKLGNVQLMCSSFAPRLSLSLRRAPLIDFGARPG